MGKEKLAVCLLQKKEIKSWVRQELQHQKKQIMKILKLIGKILLVPIGLIGLYALSAYVLSRITVAAEEEVNQDISVYILTNGVHTDLVVPTQNEQFNWAGNISHVEAPASKYKYLAIGWGDKGFYLNTPTWAELKFSTAFNAAFGLSSSAMHATYYEDMVVGENCRQLKISKSQYDRLIAFISKSFEMDEDGNPISIATNANNGITDAFYEANKTYSLFYTCNTWANSGLKHCGQKACLWTAFQEGIFLKYP